MAEVFAAAVECLVRERDSQFLQRIAADYSLNLEELQAKYLAVAEGAIKVPRKYKKREAKEVKTTDEAGQSTKCQGITAKKEPCKFSALKGGCYCKRHLEKAEGVKASPPAAKVAPVPAVEVVPPAVETEKRLAAILNAAEAASESEEDSDEEEVDREYADARAAEAAEEDSDEEEDEVDRKYAARTRQVESEEEYEDEE
jgi:hypothetical protein